MLKKFFQEKKVHARILTVILVLGVAVIVAKYASMNSAEHPSVAPQQLIVGIVSDYYPFEYRDQKTGEFLGFDVDLAKEIGKYIGSTVIFKQMDFSEIIPSLQKQHVLMGLSAISPDRERSDAVDFSIPYYSTSFVILFKDLDPIASIDDLAGQKIGIERGTSMEKYVYDYKEQKHLNLSIISYANNAAALKALYDNDINAIVIEELPAINAMMNAPNKSLAMHRLPRTVGSYAVALSKNSPLTRLVNNAIHHITNSGKMEQLRKRYGMAR